ncbi:hypothetical protein [Corynebacterium epidermidicanis]|uniref:Uncharacterized protein n=1 Tax=Corynebacterium epidermidicanis TaxID=1050174 RepID=A0A0G3GUX9_9CORY|nr:hypothetical protein [Corynebacterium epidermidicanis]AKK03338.1 hypothetical protein CEPID_07435 [Corynebacterium epidermidicanis]
MPDRDIYPDPPAWRNPALILAVVAVCIVLVTLLKTLGVLLAFVIVAAVSLAFVSRRNDPEAEAVKASVRLSAEEIDEVLKDFDRFLTGQDADSLADRTLHRPELANADSFVPEIEKFYYLYSTNVRFLNRLQARLAQNLTFGQAQHLLDITDQRAQEIQESWVAARRAAFRHGPAA